MLGECGSWLGNVRDSIGQLYVSAFGCPLHNTNTDQYDLSDVFYRWRRGTPIQNALHVVADNCSADFDSIGQYGCLSAKIELPTECRWAALVRYALPSIVVVLVSFLHFWLPTAWTTARPLSALLPVLLISGAMVCV